MPKTPPVKLTAGGDDDDYDNDDNISINSTEGSLYSESHEFEVEHVLAEKTENGKKLYLLRWQGYPLERSTWEPRGNIFDDMILANWEKTKMRESKGVVKPFNIQRFESDVNSLAEAKAERRRRRELKRRKLGFILFESDVGPGYCETSDSDSVDEALEAEDTRNDDLEVTSARKLPLLPSKQPKIPPLKHRESKVLNLNRKGFTSALPVDKSSSVSRRRQKLPQFDESSDSDEPLALRASKAGAVRKKGDIMAKDNPNRLSKLHMSGPTLDTSTSAIGRGKGASRGGSIAHKNVFAIRSASKKRPTLLQTSADPTKDMKHFKNMRLVRKAELASRALEDVAPDISAVGGLFRLGDPSAARGLKPAEFRRNSTINGIQPDRSVIEEPRSVLVDAHTSKRISELPPSISAAQTPIYKSYPERAICYFWDLKGNCSKGNACKYMHFREPGIPVAPKPGDKWAASAVSPTVDDTSLSFLSSNSGLASEVPHSTSARQEPQYQPPPPQGEVFVSSVLEGPRVKSWKYDETCFFWHTRGDCSKGDLCNFHHSYSKSMPIAPDPSRQAPIATHQYLSPEDQSLSPAAYKDMEPAPAEPNTEVCKHWKRGDCYHGSKCWFAHEAPHEAKSESPEAPKTNKPQGHPPEPPIGSQDITHKIIPGAQIENQRNYAKNKSAGSLLPVSTPIQPDFGFDNIESTIAESTPAATEPTATSTMKRNKLSVQDYRRNRVTKALGIRAKMVTFGGNDQQPLLLDTGDISQQVQHPLHQLFSGLPRVQFDQSCIAQDFASQQSALQRGVVLDGSFCPADSEDSEVSNIIDDVVKELRFRASGLVCATTSFIILTYPARAEEWEFLDCSSYPKEVRLRYLVFQSELNIGSCLRAPVNKIVGFRPPYRKALMDKIYGLCAKTLLPLVEKAHNSYNFYLLFPPAANTTASFMIQWLRSCGHSCKIYNSEIEGAWDFVVKTPSFVTCGVLVHESVASEICRLPLLQEILRKSKKIFTFWYISDSSPRFPLFPSVFDPDQSNMGQVAATRLLPHGAIIFLAPSFLVAEPEWTYELLKWFFNKKVDSVTPGTWKIAACYNLADYLLDLANSKAFERHKFYQDNPNRPSKDAEANQRGLGFESCQLRYKIHMFFTNALQSRGVSKDNCDYYSSILNELDSLVVYSDPDIDPDDEQAQIKWFAGWTMGKLDLFRKFTVVGTGSGSAKKSTRFKAPSDVTPNPNAIRQPDLPILPSAETALSEVLSSQGPNGDKPYHQTSESTLSSGVQQKALQVAAKLQALKPSEHSPANGISITGHTARSKNEHDARVSDASQKMASNDIVAAADPFSIDGMEINSELVNSAMDIDPHSAELDWKLIRFEPTTTWYKRFKANGDGWEHMVVDSWEQCWNYLGLGTGKK